MTLKRLKLGVVLGAATVIAQSANYVGYRLTDYDYYLKAVNAGGHGLLGVLLSEWAGNWLYTNSWTDSGASITAEMLVASYQVVRDLPAFFNVATAADVARVIRATCPIPYAGAFEQLPV